MVNLKILLVLIFIMCNFFLLSQSSKVKKKRGTGHLVWYPAHLSYATGDEENNKWNIIPYVGLDGILIYEGKHVKFVIEEIIKKKVKYQYYVSYPDDEYCDNWIGLDLKNKQYTTKYKLTTGNIISIANYVIGHDVDRENYLENFISYDEGNEDIEQKFQEILNLFQEILEFNKNMDLAQNEKISDIVKLEDEVNGEKYIEDFISYDRDFKPKFQEIFKNFDKKKNVFQHGRTSDIVQIYDATNNIKILKKLQRFIEFLSQSIQPYGQLNQDVIRYVEQTFGISTEQTQQIYEFMSRDKTINAPNYGKKEPSILNGQQYYPKIVFQDTKLSKNTNCEDYVEVKNDIEHILKLNIENEIDDDVNKEVYKENVISYDPVYVQEDVKEEFEPAKLNYKKKVFKTQNEESINNIKIDKVTYQIQILKMFVFISSNVFQLCFHFF